MRLYRQRWSRGSIALQVKHSTSGLVTFPWKSKYQDHGKMLTSVVANILSLPSLGRLIFVRYRGSIRRSLFPVHYTVLYDSHKAIALLTVLEVMLTSPISALLPLLNWSIHIMKAGRAGELPFDGQLHAVAASKSPKYASWWDRTLDDRPRGREGL